MAQKETSSKSRRWLGLSGAAVLVANLVLTGTTIVYPLIGGIPLAKLLPMTLEEMCEELRKRPGRSGNCIKETTVQKYLETVSSVLEDAKKNDIIPFNPAHRVRKKHFEKEVQHIPQKYEMGKLMRAIQNEPILYRAYYTCKIAELRKEDKIAEGAIKRIQRTCESNRIDQENQYTNNKNRRRNRSRQR